MVEFVIVSDEVTASIEYSERYLHESECRNMVNAWSQLVGVSLEEK